MKQKGKITKLRNQSGSISIGAKEIVIVYYEQLYAKKLYNLHEMDKFLETKPTNTHLQRDKKSE